MKNIKELIYAAVEENAVAFQELAGGILQARAYDAIEALRPEVGASMFGESSHMKGEDDEEDDEDEEMEDEDEDEEEMDDKKKSMKEALHPNQQKIDVVDDEKIDAKDFAKLRKTKNEETTKNIFRNPTVPAKDQLKDPPKQIKVKEEVEGLDELSAALLQRTAKAASARSQAFDAEKNRIAKMPHQQRDAPEREAKQKTYDKASQHYSALANKASAHKANMADKMATKNLQSKLPAKMRNANEEVEQIDEIGDTPRGKAALTNLASQRFGRARWAGGVHSALHNHDGDYGPRKISSPHSRLADKDAAVAHKAAAKAGVKPHEVPSHNYEYEKKGGYGYGHDPAHKLAARNTPKMEEVEGLDELSTDKLTKYTKAANASRASLNKKWDQGKASQRDKEKVINHEKGEDRAHKVLDRRALVDKEMNEVAMPQNQADMLAHILHQVKISGHPVATDAQFRATTVGKDTTKKASLEPGADKLQYTIAQGGNVKP